MVGGKDLLTQATMMTMILVMVTLFQVSAQTGLAAARQAMRRRIPTLAYPRSAVSNQTSPELHTKKACKDYTLYFS